MSSFVSDDVAKSCAYGDVALSRIACGVVYIRCRCDVRIRDVSARLYIFCRGGRSERASPRSLGGSRRARVSSRAVWADARSTPVRIGARARVSSFAKHVRVRPGPVPRRPLADRRRVLLNGWARAKKSHASRRTLHCGMYSGFEENGRSTPSACARSFGLWLLYITLHSCSSSPSDCVMVPRPNLATGDDGNVAPRRNADLGATPAGRSPRALAPRSDPDDARSRRSTAGGVCPPPRRARLEDPRQCRLCGEPRGPRKPFRGAVLRAFGSQCSFSRIRRV